MWLLIVLAVIALLSVRIVNEWERGIVLTLGRYSRKAKPGVNLIIPIVENLIKVDMRITTLDIPKQEVITKDNVTVRVNAVVYMKIEDEEKAILRIRDLHYAVAQYAQTALRDVIGEVELDELLANREEVAEKIRKLVDEETADWGVDIVAIKLQDVELPDNMKRAMARQAEAEREKRAVIIKSQGEVVAAENLLKAAKMLEKAPAAIHLRTLQTLVDVSSDKNTIIFTLPLELVRGFEKALKRKA